MKHVMLSSAWEYGEEPFPAYRCNLVYGRNKRDREFLPAKDVVPVTQYTVIAGNSETLYSGTDKAVAEAARARYDSLPVVLVGDDIPTSGEYRNNDWDKAGLKASQPTLPEGKFRVIKTKEKGTLLVVPGDDASNRCLLFVGCAGGFRGGVSVLANGTTGNLLKECSAGNNCESSTEVIVILDVGQSVAFHSFGRRTDEVYTYTWDGAEVEQRHYSKSEWDNRNAIEATEDAQVL